MKKCNHQHHQWSTTFENPLVQLTSCFVLQRSGLQFGHLVTTFWRRTTKRGVQGIRQDRLQIRSGWKNCLHKVLHPAQGKPQQQVGRKEATHKNTHTQAPPTSNQGGPKIENLANTPLHAVACNVEQTSESHDNPLADQQQHQQ